MQHLSLFSSSILFLRLVKLMQLILRIVPFSIVKILSSCQKLSWFLSCVAMSMNTRSTIQSFRCVLAVIEYTKILCNEKWKIEVLFFFFFFYTVVNPFHSIKEKGDHSKHVLRNKRVDLSRSIVKSKIVKTAGTEISLERSKKKCTWNVHVTQQFVKYKY